MSLIRKHGAVLQAWACLDLVSIYDGVSLCVWQWAANIYNEGTRFSYRSWHKEEMVAFEHTSC